jgi:hypothetical protein
MSRVVLELLALGKAFCGDHNVRSCIAQSVTQAVVEIIPAGMYLECVVVKVTQLRPE